MNEHRRLIVSGLLALGAGKAITFSGTAAAEERRLFVRSAVENRDGTATLPLYQGTSRGRPVWYILLDSSDGADADRLGINRASKLSNARGTPAVQRISVVNGVIDFPKTVDFRPQRVVVPGPTGFPPAQAEPGDRKSVV